MMPCRDSLYGGGSILKILILRIVAILSGTAMIAAFFLPWLDTLSFLVHAAGMDDTSWGQGGPTMYETAAQLVKNGHVYRLLVIPTMGLAILLSAFRRPGQLANVALMGGAIIIIWWLIDPFFGALLPLWSANMGLQIGRRGLVTIGMLAGFALLLAVWKPKGTTKRVAVGLFLMLIGAILVPGIDLYLAGAKIGVHMTIGAAVILFVAALATHPGARATQAKKMPRTDGKSPKTTSRA